MDFVDIQTCRASCFDFSLLLNGSKLSSPKFLYLIRDDVFTSSDRSKFFDFIIPVVPVVATDNAYNLLLNGISDLPEQSEFEQPFLRAVSLYLSDLRLINNIINEYKIYSSLLSGSDLVRNPNQQLAIILYKNLYPKDFSDLRCASGYVYSVISERAALIAVQRTALESKRQEIQNRIALVHKEHLQNLDELDRIAVAHPVFDHVIRRITFIPRNIRQ